MYFFAGFVLDPDHAELRDAGGSVTHLRPKTLDLFKLLATNSHRVLSKEELMEAVWPGIHVGEDSLFQCIREIRAALGDTRREMVQVVSGRGYRFALDVSTERQASPPGGHAPDGHGQDGYGQDGRRQDRLRRLAGPAGLLLLATAALAAFLAGGDRFFPPARPVVTLLPIVATSPEETALARDITAELVKGFSRIDGVDLVLRDDAATPARQGRGALEIRSVLRRSTDAWALEARLVEAGSGTVHTVADITVDAGGTGPETLLPRLVAGIGYPLATRLNALQTADARAGEPSDVAIRQAIAAINQTTRERFGTARAILERHLAGEPGDVDAQVALAGLHLRGIQMSWYGAAESVAAQNGARALLEEALKAKPRSQPALDVYCRFLTVTNQFTESLVACARALSTNPWNGTANYNLGLTQLQLGRFTDALASFTEADRFDTPEVSRWTWPLGIGWVNLLLGNDAAAVAHLNRSIAITPGSGRPYLLLAAAYQRLGRREEAKAALARALELRPGSTARNIAPPTRNTGSAFLAASNAAILTLIEIGLSPGTPR